MNFVWLRLVCRQCNILYTIYFLLTGVFKVAWQDQMTIMLRYTIGDVSCPNTYSDSRLQQALVIGAQYVSPSLNFSQQFTVNVVDIDISPDPTVSPTIDDWFTNLTVLKTAYQILFNEWKLLTNGGAIMFKEGSAMV